MNYLGGEVGEGGTFYVDILAEFFFKDPLNKILVLNHYIQSISD